MNAFMLTMTTFAPVTKGFHEILPWKSARRTVVAYLMMHNAMTLKQVYIHVKSCRQLILPNAGFQQQLIALERRLYTTMSRRQPWYMQMTGLKKYTRSNVVAKEDPAQIAKFRPIHSPEIKLRWIVTHSYSFLIYLSHIHIGILN